jgi:hypothetical protein
MSRWDEVAVAYAAYQAPVIEALSAPTRLPSAFVGLHPPLYGVLHASVEALWPAPMAFLSLSILASTLAVVAVVKLGEAIGGPTVGLSAGALAATAPGALHYAAELNNYPLLLALVAALYLTGWRAMRDARRWIALVVIAVALAWTHVLGGILGGAVLLSFWWVHRAIGTRALLAFGLACAPVVVTGIRLTMDGATFNQPSILVGESLADAWDRFGVWPWLGVGLAVVGASGQRWLAGHGLLAVTVIVGMVVGAIAAPHQFPYWTVLMPLIAVLAALSGARHRLLAAAVVGLACAQGLVAVHAFSADLKHLTTDASRQRAIDVALAQSQPGDAIWLISPALQPDDDKRALSPVLWRIRPWRVFPVSRPFPFDYTDYQFGQPRLYQGRVIYTFTDFWIDRMDRILSHHIQAGQTVWIALYDHGPAHRYPERLDYVLRPWKTQTQSVGDDRWGLGVDQLVEVMGYAQEGSE